MRKLLTTKEAGERLGVTAGRIRQLVISGKLPAEKFGRDLMIDEKDLKLVAIRPMGRPSKKRRKRAAKKPENE